jgi:hypothetical protein
VFFDYKGSMQPYGRVRLGIEAGVPAQAGVWWGSAPTEKDVGVECAVAARPVWYVCRR